MKEAKDWQEKLTVENSRIQMLRRGISTELSNRGLQASCQTDRLLGLLKDKPAKKGLLPRACPRVGAIPALSVFSGCNQEQDIVGFLPGPSSSHSLKLNSNVIPLLRPAHPSEGLHPCDFNLNVSTHTQHPMLLSTVTETTGQ